MQSEWNVKIHLCCFCDKMFRTAANLARHENIHTGRKPFICDYCDRGFGDPSALRRHKRIHTGEKPYSCYVCGRRFNQKYAMRLHLGVHSKKMWTDTLRRSEQKAENLLEHSTLGKHFNRQYFEIFFIFFCQKTGFEISYKLSPFIKIHHNLFITQFIITLFWI